MLISHVGESGRCSRDHCNAINSIMRRKRYQRIALKELDGALYKLALRSQQA